MTKLTDERRALLQALLEDEGIEISPAYTIKRAGTQEHAPLSFAQKRLWFLDQLQPENAFYNMCESIHLTGPLLPSALEQSYNALLRRHTILRTIFVVRDDEPVQAIQPYTWTSITLIDLRACPEQERERVLHRLATQEAEQPFRLHQGPLLRVRLLLLARNEHVLLFSMHHIIADGWSTGLLLRELVTSYTACLAGKVPSGTDLPLQYTDYAFWQQEWLQSQQFLDQLAYWKQQLADAPAVLELPTDYPRPPIESHRGKQMHFSLPATLLQHLKTACEQEEVTLFMWLLAVFQIVLHRYSNQEDILVGSPIAGRTYPELEELIGYFANTLVLRTTMQSGHTFQEVLARVKTMTLDAFAHQEMPFERLVEALHIERSLSYNPLFQVLFVVQNLPATPLLLPGLEIQASPPGEQQTARFDLTLALEEQGQELIGSIEYNADLFAPATIQRLSGHFQVLLTQTLVRRDQRIADLPLLTTAERQEILVDWNTSSSTQQEAHCLHRLFEEQVAQTPDVVALLAAQQTLTYSALNEQADRLVQRLQHLQIHLEQPVAVCLERTPDLLISLLAILKAGGAYVPLDPRTPTLRLGSMLTESQATLLITQRDLLPGFVPPELQVLYLEEEWPLLAELAADQPPAQTMLAVHPDNLAYIIFTSGSTGEPKGVQITHAAICNLLIAMQGILSVDAHTVMAALASFAFDMSLPELFLPLLCGAQELLLEQEVALEPERLLRLLREYGVNCIQATPTSWSLLLDAGLLKQQLDLTCISGAEALSWELAVQLLQNACPLYNFYGPTETTVWSLQQRISRDDGQVFIGRPLANTWLYILDSNWQAVPAGIPGELYIGGNGLARGYLHRPDLTAERFIPHPFSSQPGARLYRSGDLVRYREQGVIEYLGRRDRQIKLRGFRIEPGEIEKTLRQHPLIRDAVVLNRAEQPEQQHLVAYLIPREQASLQGEQIRHFLRERLPDYMLPTVFLSLDAFPLTPNGKIHYQALPSPSPERPELQHHFVAPRDTLEVQIARVWQDILKITPIGVTDNFFELGGNSFSAVRLMAHLQHTFHHSLPLSLLFQEGTIEQLAHRLRLHFLEKQPSPVVLLQEGNGQRPLFCVHPGGGNVLCYRDLVQHIGPEQSIYGIEDLRLLLEQGAPSFTSIEEMASFYLAALRAQQPEGPYLLGGWSSGGLIAFEMARQLLQQEQQVGLLALFDTQSPPLLRQIINQDEGVALARFIQQQAREAGLAWPFDLETISRLETDAQIELLIDMIRQEKLAQPAIVRPWIQRFLQLTQIGKEMIQRYQPGPYAGEITLFRAETSTTDIQADLTPALAAMYQQATYGWEDYTPYPLRVYAVSGTHDTIMNTQNVQHLAKLLKQSIDHATL